MRGITGIVRALGGALLLASAAAAADAPPRDFKTYQPKATATRIDTADAPKIDGNISDQRAERIEDLLWNLIPEAGHLRDQVGRIDIANGARSHPLALTQLLVGYHAVKAAMGVSAY